LSPATGAPEFNAHELQYDQDIHLKEVCSDGWLHRLSTTLKSKRSAQARMAEGERMEARKGQDAKAAWFMTAARQARLTLNAF